VVKDCLWLQQHADSVHIEEESIASFAKSLTEEERARWARGRLSRSYRGRALRVDFEGPLKPGEEIFLELTAPLRREIIFLAAIDLMNFASGYRHLFTSKARKELISHRNHP
jgi:hypothetical protein